MSSTNKRIAFFKVRPSRTIPLRSGPVQCIRNCPNCVLQQRTYDNADEFEHLLLLKTYDDLVARKSFWLSRFQTIQYHVGQVDVLKRALEKDAPTNVIYIVAVTRASDTNFLNIVLDHVRLPNVCIVGNEGIDLELIKSIRKEVPTALPIQLRSCVNHNNFLDPKNFACFGAKGLRDLLDPIVNVALADRQFSITVVPVVITKELDGLKNYGLGSLCVQILEPYSLQTYMSRIETKHVSTYFVQHLYFDVSLNAVLFPPHLVAFLVLYLERSDGISMDDLAQYFGWFRRSAVFNNMHLGFTGSSRRAIKQALTFLKDFIHFESSTVCRPKDIERLKDYANLVTPLFAYQGVFARAIMIEYNNTVINQKDIRTIFTPDLRVQVERENVVEVCSGLAEVVERRFACRRPCLTIESTIESTINQMQAIAHYFRIEEPKINRNRSTGWAGDLDNDEDEYRFNRDHRSLKTWILLTQRDYRLDRLNLFINAIESHLYKNK